MNKNYIARSGRKANESRVKKIKKNLDKAKSQLEIPMRKEVTQDNFLDVLEKIKQHYIANDAPHNWDREIWVEKFEEMLEDLFQEDFFGTEGQLDPRGDHRG